MCILVHHPDWVLTLSEGNPIESISWDEPWDNGPSSPSPTSKQALVRLLACPPCR